MSIRLARRRFLTIAAAASAGAALFDVPRILQAANLAAKDDPFGGFPLGAQSYSLREFNTEEVIRHLHGMGLHRVEFFSQHLDPNWSDDRINETKKLLAKADISISGHGVHGFTADHDKNRKLFEFAKQIGTKVITANPQPDSLDSLDKLVAEYDICIAIHNHGPNALYDKLDSVVQAVKGRHKNLGACVDTGHFIRSGEDPVKCVYELKGRVFGVHVKDEPKVGPASHNVIIGKGLLDVVGLFKAIKDVKFPAYGSLSLEYEANPKNPIDDMKACLEVAKEAIAKVA